MKTPESIGLEGSAGPIIRLKSVINTSAFDPEAVVRLYLEQDEQGNANAEMRATITANRRAVRSATTMIPGCLNLTTTLLGLTL